MIVRSFDRRFGRTGGNSIPGLVRHMDTITESDVPGWGQPVSGVYVYSGAPASSLGYDQNIYSR